MIRVFAAIMVLVIVIAGNVAAIDAFGSVFGTLTTATTVGDGKGDLQLGVGAADLTSVFGTFSYGISDFTEIRFKLGLADNEGYDTKLAFGADFKHQLMDHGAGLNDPFDLTFGGMFEYVDIGPLSVWQLGAKTIGSIPYAMKNGTTLSPYASINIRLEGYSQDDFVVWNGAERHVVKGGSETELKFGMGFGVEWKLNENISLLGEFQFDGNEGLFLALNYGML